MDYSGLESPEYIQEIPIAGQLSGEPVQRIWRWDINNRLPVALELSCGAAAYFASLLLAARIGLGSAHLLFTPSVLGWPTWFFPVLGLVWAVLLATIGTLSWGKANNRALTGYFRAEVILLLVLCGAYALGASHVVCEGYLAGSLCYLPVAWLLGNASVHINRSGRLIRHDARVLIIGAKSRACDTISALRRTGEKYEIIGCLDPDSSLVGSSVEGVQVVGTTKELPGYLFGQPLDLVIFALPLTLVPDARNMIGSALETGIPISVVMDFGLQGLGFGPNNTIADSRSHSVETVILSNVPHNASYLMLKRVCDIVVSACLLMLLLPVFLLVAILIKLTSPDGPIFYPWRVVGQNRRPFVGYKFRTMVPNADRLKEQLMRHNEMTGPVFKMRNDPRVTPLGRILRMYSIDELPQLYSVLKGDMSLVGPRPPSKQEADQFEFWQRRKLSIKPGITCLWQVSGRSEITSFAEWARLDLQYIRQASLWLDLAILLKTVPAVLGGRGAH